MISVSSYINTEVKQFGQSMLYYQISNVSFLLLNIRPIF